MIVYDEIDIQHIGKIIKTHSGKLGDGYYLVIKVNAKYFHDFMKFVKLPGYSVMDWDSMMNDEVLEIIDFNFVTLLEIKQNKDVSIGDRIMTCLKIIETWDNSPAKGKIDVWHVKDIFAREFPELKDKINCL